MVIKFFSCSSLSSVWSSLRNETDAAARSHMETAKMLMDEYSELNDALITLANKRRSLEEQVRCDVESVI